MTDQQLLDVYNLRQSCQQAEDALSQGMEKLQQTLAESVAAGQLGEGSYIPQMGTAMEKLEALVSFLNQVIRCSFSNLLLKIVAYYGLVSSFLYLVIKFFLFFIF